jgi:hypothetical protein
MHFCCATTNRFYLFKYEQGGDGLMQRIICCIVFLLCFTIAGCGDDIFTQNQQPAKDPIVTEVITKYHFHTTGEPQTQEVTLPQELNDANWGLKEYLCQQAGYDLAPFAGQTVAVVRYPILERYYGEPLYLHSGDSLYHYGVPLNLWIVETENTAICAYTADSGEFGSDPGVYPVQERIVGNWVWSETSGGVAGVHETPESTGETRKVVFDNDGKATFYTNGLATVSSTYTLATEKTLLAEDPLYVVKVEGISLDYVFSFPSANELMLQENAVDGFTYVYRKE